jgi:hypothetical protein
MIAESKARFLLWRTLPEADAADKSRCAYRAAGKRQLATASIHSAGSNVRYRRMRARDTSWHLTDLVPSQRDSD